MNWLEIRKLEFCYLRKKKKIQPNILKIIKSSMLFIAYTQKRQSHNQLGHRVNRRNSEYLATNNVERLLKDVDVESWIKSM